jgi:hypothetical protein
MPALSQPARQRAIGGVFGAAVVLAVQRGER